MQRPAFLTLTRSELLLQLRRPVIAAVHACLIVLAWFGSFAVRLDFNVADQFRTAMLSTLPFVIVIKLAVFYAFRLFQGWWKYVGLNDLIDIAKASAVGTAGVFLAILGIFGTTDFPRSVLLLDLIFTFLLIGGVRFVVRAYTESFLFSVGSAAVKRVLVVGAGRTGMTMVREMRTNRALGYEPVGFVDDDPSKWNIRVDGIPVWGSTKDIPALLARLDVDEVLLAFSTRSGRDIRRIMEACHDSRVVVKTMPSVGDLIDGRISVNRIRDVRIDDLLGREVIKTNLTLVRSNTEGHVVLVTGAAGSIGSELSRQLARLGPAHLVLFERSESDLHDLELLLRELLPNVQLTAIVGDILDTADLASAFEQHRPSRVYHAAAYKHVTMMERHVVAAVRNNVIGTFNVATVAERFGVEQLVLISTDKAVRPTSLMGATKRAAERVLLSMAGGPTRFTAVRFGNVLGSRGSVVPIFKRQIEMGGPVTVTHPDVVRFFMTIPEAVQLVLQAAATSRGNDVFHLDMGEPVRIADLAENMIRLSGFEPGRDIEIKFVGLRPGEKLYEELLVDGEDVVEPTDHPRVRVVRTVDKGVSPGWIQAIRRAADARDVSELVALISAAVPEFTPSELMSGGRPASRPRAADVPS
ncbi:MAG TPA: nucleoside-diphosphate sugar epimerase/dehydratase [Vicinamibacterales bacterium]